MELTDYALIAISSLIILASIALLIKTCFKRREPQISIENIVTDWS